MASRVWVLLLFAIVSAKPRAQPPKPPDGNWNANSGWPSVGKRPPPSEGCDDGDTGMTQRGLANGMVNGDNLETWPNADSDDLGGLSHDVKGYVTSAEAYDSRRRVKRNTFHNRGLPGDIVFPNSADLLPTHCRLLAVKQVVVVANCTSVTVLNNACVGVCRSYHIPRLATTDQRELQYAEEGQTTVFQDFYLVYRACITIATATKSVTVTCDDNAEGGDQHMETFTYDLVERCRCRTQYHSD